MNSNIKRIIFVFALFTLFEASAQQEAHFTQYMYNTNVINPAYAGNRNVLSLNAIHRSQWVGIEGAPSTQTLSLHSPMGRKVGLGLNILSDNIGASSIKNVNTDFSYTLTLNEEDLKLALGIKAGIHSLNVDFNRLLVSDNTDSSIQNNNFNKISPTVGVGGYLFTKSWYVGLSSPNFLETKYFSNSSVSRVNERIHAYLIGGYVLDINPNLKFKPATLLKMVNGAPLSLDLSANFLINRKFTLGTSYRLGAAFSALAGAQISNQIMIGYAYDYDTTDLRNFNSGSHEFFIRFESFTRVKGKVSPRFF
jgi:type IX secretion system PorP/SprF family membrane protein